MEINEVIDRLGHFGRYQRQQYFLQGLTMMTGAYQMLASVFVLAIPEHRCAVPNLANDTYRIQGQWHARLVERYVPVTSSPEGNDVYSKCDLKHGIGIESTRTPLNFTGEDVLGNETYRCSRWVFDDSIFSLTAASQLELVCDRELTKSHLVMSLMAGQMAGCLVAGPLADAFGRQRVLIVSLLIHTVVSIATSFATDPYAFGTLSFSNGFIIASILCPSYTLAMELVGQKWRHVLGLIIFTFWTLGMALLALAAYFVRDWRHLLLVGSCPSILFLSYYFLVPESARWLLSKGRHEEATEILEKAAATNRVKLANMDSIMLSDSSDQGHSESILTLFKYPWLILRLIVVYINWFVCSLTYYGLSLNVGSLSGNLFLNFFFSAAFECLGYTAMSLIVMKVGRKTLYCGSILLAGSACLLTIFPVLFGDESTLWTVRVLANVGKFGVSGAFAMAWMWTTELFPTPFRASVISTSSFFARAGGVSASYIAFMNSDGQVGKVFPQIVFGTGGLVVGLMAWMLPETRDKHLPQSVKEVTQPRKTIWKQDIQNKKRPLGNSHPPTSPLINDATV